MKSNQIIKEKIILILMLVKINMKLINFSMLLIKFNAQNQLKVRREIKF